MKLFTSHGPLVFMAQNFFAKYHVAIYPAMQYDYQSMLTLSKVDGGPQYLNAMRSRLHLRS